MRKIPILAMLLFTAAAVLPIAGNAAKATVNHPDASSTAKTVVKPAKSLPAPKKETKPVVGSDLGSRVLALGSIAAWLNT